MVVINKLKGQALCVPFEFPKPMLYICTQSELRRQTMPARKIIKLEKVGIRLTENSHFPGELAPYFVFGIDHHGIGHGIDDVQWFATRGFAYNAFVGSDEWKALHPKVMRLMSSSGTSEFCSNELKKPEDILRELHKVFESPVLDKFIETLDQTLAVDVSGAVGAGVTFHSSPKGKQVLEEKKQAQTQEHDKPTTTATAVLS